MIQDDENQEDETPCSDFEEVLIRFLDGDLCAACCRGVEAHMASCEACARYFRAVEATDAALRDLFFREKRFRTERARRRQRRLLAFAGCAVLATFIVATVDLVRSLAARRVHDARKETEGLVSWVPGRSRAADTFQRRRA